MKIDYLIQNEDELYDKVYHFNLKNFISINQILVLPKHNLQFFPYLLIL